MSPALYPNVSPASASSEPWPFAIACHGLTLERSRWVTLLRDVHLQVPAGAIVGLVGRNGAGKSTLLECLVGLIAPTRGRCELLGEPALALSDEAKGRLGFVAQAPDLFSWLNGHAHLQQFATVYPGWSERRAVELALRLDLNLATPAGRLSVGDQQKLSVVLAMAHDPDVLILDEPVASLDPMTRREFMRALFERPQPSDLPRTVLISSHLLADLERVVTHVAFLRRGELQLMDEWDALVENVRLLERPAGQGAGPHRVLHRRSIGGMERLVFDRRGEPGWGAAGRPLNLDELFLELNGDEDPPLRRSFTHGAVNR